MNKSVQAWESQVDRSLHRSQRAAAHYDAGIYIDNCIAEHPLQLGDLTVSTVDLKEWLLDNAQAVMAYLSTMTASDEAGRPT